MKVLLDTHTLIWAVLAPKNLSDQARAAIGADENVVFVSMASLWELRIKEGVKKINLPADFYNALPDKGFELLSVSLPHICELGRLPHYHRDPFDRMLVAQARSEQLILVTRDEEIKKYPISCLMA